MTRRPDDYVSMITPPIDTDPEHIKNGVIRLTGGSPGFTCLTDVPELLIKSTQDCLTRRDGLNNMLSYCNPAGYPPFLDELAKFLTQAYGDNIHSSRLMSTGGSQHALALLAKFFTGTNAPIFLTQPCYNGHRTILAQEFKFNCIPVLTDDRGIDPDDLHCKLEGARLSSGTDHVTEDQPYWGMLCLVSVFDNPTGCCLAPERCDRLIELSERYNLLLVSDDIYCLLHYTDEKYPPPRLMRFEDRSSVDFEGRVVSLGSFSKLVAPGLRVGWIEGPPKLLHKLSAFPSMSGGSVCQYTSAVLSSAFQLGLIQQHLVRVRNIYKNRLLEVVNVLQNNLPSEATFTSPRGGYFIWIQLPGYVNTADLCEFCMSKFKVNVAPGEIYFLGVPEQKFIRISFGYYEEEILIEGVHRFCQALKEYLQKHKASRVNQSSTQMLSLTYIKV